MHAPEFWKHDGTAARLLSPAALCWRAGSAIRRLGARPSGVGVPVICVGNAVAGGAGKTPVVMSLARILTARGIGVHLLSRGYGGTDPGPVRVDPAVHGFREVGDEPLLLATVAPTWVARRRVAGARAAAAAGAQVIIMDDGLQHPHLVKDLSFLVVDGGYGFGNGRLIPAGPLREPVSAAMARVGAIVLMGEDRHGLEVCFPREKPVHRARVVPVAASLSGCRVVAFAGMGRPGKFFETLTNMGCTLVEVRPFGDHHVYTEAEVMKLVESAQSAGARLVTTEKDHVRLPAPFRSAVKPVAVRVDWRDRKTLDKLIQDFVTTSGH